MDDLFVEREQHNQKKAQLMRCPLFYAEGIFEREKMELINLYHNLKSARSNRIERALQTVEKPAWPKASEGRIV